MKYNNILITGGLGFIGTNFLKLIKKKYENEFKSIINFDKISYCSNPQIVNNLKLKSYYFHKTDLLNKSKINNLLRKYQIDVVVHFAAESHVDNSILSPDNFIKSNILGTFYLLDACKDYLKNKNNLKFKFIHISTDEVYGSLKPNDKPFTESSNYKPNSPYSASKASSDLIVRSYIKTYNFPAIITNCSNNYGPFQYPEKLIPLVIKKCLTKKKIPIYGNGKQIRNWLHVDDHCEAILAIIKNGVIGNKYNIGSDLEINNLNLINKICKLLNNFQPNIKFDYKSLKTFVADRPSHDTRYSINYIKIYKELGWKPRIPFEEGIESTVKWYLNNEDWIK